MPIQSRRRFLTNTAFAGAAGLGGFGAWDRPLAAEPRGSRMTPPLAAPQHTSDAISSPPVTHYRTAAVEGLDIFYREAGRRCRWPDRR